VVPSGPSFTCCISSEVSAAVEIFVFQVVTVLIFRLALGFGSVESEGSVAVQFVCGFVRTDFESHGISRRCVASGGRNCEESAVVFDDIVVVPGLVNSSVGYG